MTKRREEFYKRNKGITKKLDKHFKEWLRVKDYYKQEFEKLHEHVGALKVYVGEKLSHANFEGANESYIKQLEAEYYALQTIWVNMNAIHRDRPRVKE
mgnify:FL=1